jgi:hypothetical protein
MMVVADVVLLIVVPVLEIVPPLLIVVTPVPSEVIPRSPADSVRPIATFTVFAPQQDTSTASSSTVTSP